MLHHPGVSLSECLKNNPRVDDHTCWHAAICPPDQLLWLYKHRLHIQTVSYVACIGIPAMYEQSSWYASLLETCVTCSRPCHAAIWLTDTHSIDLSGNKYHACCERIQLCSLWFLPCWHYSAKVVPTRYTCAFIVSCEIFECAILQFTISSIQCVT